MVTDAVPTVKLTIICDFFASIGGLTYGEAMQSINNKQDIAR